jgi:GH24 family phage-related lysozyme (muramidase)
MWWSQKRRARKTEELLRKLERAELQAAINNLDRTRNNVEELVRRMLEERRA